ncbi:MAG: HTTM domain-containing protein [Taibaiella sp.]|nr:HTTM domain-containing protein [Taibaiella sp.]
MKKILSKYVFFSNTGNTDWLVFFRITVSAFCLLQFIAIIPDINNFIGGNAYVVPDIVDVHVGGIFPTINTLNNLSLKYLDVSFAVNYFCIMYIVALLCLVAGFFTRPMAIVAAFFHLTFISSIDFFAYGVDFFCTIALFYCVVFPVGRYLSIDSFIRTRRGKYKKPDPIAVVLCLRVLQIHLCIAYFFSGLLKLIGFNWWNGESIWKSIHLSFCPNIINIDFLSHTPIFLIIGWGTIITEMLYPLFINIKKTRPIWLILVVGLHLSIALFIGLFLFSTFMIILSVSAFYIPYMKIKIPYSESKVNELVYANII